MKRTSIGPTWQEAKATLLRFPAVLVCGALAAAVSIHHFNDRDGGDRPMQRVMVLALGIPLFFALRLWQERPPWRRPLSRAAVGGSLLAAAALLVLYRHWLRHETGDASWLRYFQLTLAVDLAVAIAPFLGRGETNGFWQFNRRLFQRFFLSGIYATVFFAGLALAILAVDHLFDVKVNPSLYPRLWFFTVFVFLPWHFLAGVPRDLAGLEGDREHPKALRIFSQSLLVPLVGLYVAILYGYTAKILVTRQWPQGWVGWLVSFASGFGVLTILLLQPGRGDPERRWVDRFARGFHAAILPLLGLLFAALGKRVGQYGVTEKRYWLFILGAWLVGIALFMLFRRAPSIKAVPATLALLALVTSFGPWGAFQVSLRSQTRRLEALLSRHGLLASGTLRPSAAEVPNGDVKEISAVVDYLASYHGPAPLDRLMRDPAPPGRARPWKNGQDIREAFMGEMKLTYLRPWEDEASPDTDSFHPAEDGREVAGYESLYDCYFMRKTEGMPTVRYWCRFDEHGRAVEILRGPEVLLTMPVAPLLQRLATATSGAVPAADLCVTGGDDRLRAKACFLTLNIRNDDAGARAAWTGNGYVLIDEHPTKEVR